MKSNLRPPLIATLLLLIVALTRAKAQTNPAPPTPPAASVHADTDLVTPPPPEDIWIGQDWHEPDLMVTNVSFDSLPISEIARYLRERFKDAFDIMIPPPPQASGGSGPADPESWPVKLQLKNVSASEIFRAMNLFFQTENAPFRWQLMANGSRSLAILRTLPQTQNINPQIDPTSGLPVSSPPTLPAPPKQVVVFYVGDLIGSGAMTMKQITDTLSDVNSKGYGGDIFIGYHEDTELVIVKGTGDQIGLVHNTLDALKEKMLYTVNHGTSAATAPKSDAGAGSK